MKDFLRHYYYEIIEDKVKLVSNICLIGGFVIIFLGDAISKFIPPGRPTDILHLWIAALFFVLLGVFGVTLILMKDTIFIIPLRGIPAVLLGLFEALIGFGFAIYGIVINFPLLTGH
jgi:hypothetical protein